MGQHCWPGSCGIGLCKQGRMASNGTHCCNKYTFTGHLDARRVTEGNFSQGSLVVQYSRCSCTAHCACAMTCLSRVNTTYEQLSALSARKPRVHASYDQRRYFATRRKRGTCVRTHLLTSQQLRAQRCDSAGPVVGGRLSRRKERKHVCVLRWHSYRSNDGASAIACILCPWHYRALLHTDDA